MRFERMILNRGTLDGARILSADTIALMTRNQIGDVGVRALKTAQPNLSMDFSFVEMQFLPFADTSALAIYDAFERGVYALNDGTKG